MNQKITRELLSKSTTTLAASRSVFQTVAVLKIERFQYCSQGFVSFLIQYTLMKKGILSPESTKNWEQECHNIALFIANVDIKILEKNISGILNICILISLYMVVLLHLWSLKFNAWITTKLIVIIFVHTLYLLFFLKIILLFFCLVCEYKFWLASYRLKTLHFSKYLIRFKLV